MCGLCWGFVSKKSRKSVIFFNFLNLTIKLKKSEAKKVIFDAVASEVTFLCGVFGGPNILLMVLLSW